MATTSGHKEGQASLSMKGVEAPITAEGFNHLHLNVRDLARSIRFYKEAFGLKVGFSAGPELIFMVPESEDTRWPCTWSSRTSWSGWQADSSTSGSSSTSTITIG